MATLKVPVLPEQSSSEDITVRVEDLLVGTILERPLCDKSGRLLLAEGTTITAAVKKKLALRNLGSVRVSAIDASRLTLDDSLLEEDPGFFLSDELAQKLDAIIDQGLLLVKNDGPALKNQMVFNGRKAFDARKREALLRQHQATSKTLDSMMRAAVHGRELQGKEITQLVATYLTEMTDDNQLVLSVALNAEKRGLSEQSLQTALLAMSIGIELGLDADNVRLLGICGLVHDWGMTRVPERITHKNGPLTPVEFLEIQKHPIYSVELLQNVSGIPEIVPLVVYQVHERLNGTGYPRGRCGNSIHLFARILNVADTYTALTVRRSYRPPLIPYAAIECLLHQSAQKSVDPKVVTALLNAFSLFPIGSFVGLSDGSIAQVLRPNAGQYHDPIVQVIRDPKGRRVDASDPESLIDLAESEVKVLQAIPTPGKDEVFFSPELLTGSAGTKSRG